MTIINFQKELNTTLLKRNKNAISETVGILWYILSSMIASDNILTLKISNSIHFPELKSLFPLNNPTYLDTTSLSILKNQSRATLRTIQSIDYVFATTLFP